MLDFINLGIPRNTVIKDPLVCMCMIELTIFQGFMYTIVICILSIYNACIIHLTIVLHIVLLKRLFSLLRIIIMVLSLSMMLLFLIKSGTTYVTF